MSCAVLEWGGELGKHPALLRVPAKQGFDVHRGMAKVVVLRMNRQKRKTTQQSEQSFTLATAEPITFLVAKPYVELVIFPGAQIELITWKDPKRPDAHIRRFEL